MTGLHPVLLALVVALLAGTASYWLIGIRGRRATESACGIDALAALKWRDFAHFVLEALRRDGFVEEDIERQPGDSGFDFMLGRDGQRHLLSCKHGRAYVLGEQAVREFATAIRMQGADGGVIATLGKVDGFAREIAEAHRIDLIDGNLLWPRVALLMSPQVRERVQQEAAERVNRRLMAAGAGCLGLGLAAFLATNALMAPAPATDSAVAASTTVGTGTPSPGARESAPPTTQDPAAGTPAEYDEATLNARRAAAMQRIDGLPSVLRAVWSTRSTLVVSMRAGGEEIADAAIDDACSILVEYEELRYTRLQIDPPENSSLPVRWRQCR